MKISVELFGAAREFSNTKYLEFNFSKSCKIIDLKKQLYEHVDNKFNGFQLSLNLLFLFKNSLDKLNK